MKLQKLRRKDQNAPKNLKNLSEYLYEDQLCYYRVVFRVKFKDLGGFLLNIRVLIGVFVTFKNSVLVQNYFEAIPGTPPCPPNKSVPTYAIDVIGSRSAFRSPKDFAFEYRISELALHNHVQLQRHLRAKGGIQVFDRSVNIASTFWQTFISIQRQYWRNINYSWGRMIGFLLQSIILGSVFYNIDIRTTTGMNSRSGAIFISCVLVGMTNAQNVIPQMIQVNAAQKRERAVKQARVSLYNISYTLAEVCHSESLPLKLNDDEYLIYVTSPCLFTNNFFLF